MRHSGLIPTEWKLFECSYMNYYCLLAMISGLLLGCGWHTMFNSVEMELAVKLPMISATKVIYLSLKTSIFSYSQFLLQSEIILYFPADISLVLSADCANTISTLSDL